MLDSYVQAAALAVLLLDSANLRSYVESTGDCLPFRLDVGEVEFYARGVDGSAWQSRVGRLALAEHLSDFRSRWRAHQL